MCCVLHHLSCLKKTCLRQVVLDKWLPLNQVAVLRSPIQLWILQYSPNKRRAGLQVHMHRCTLSVLWISWSSIRRVLTARRRLQQASTCRSHTVNNGSAWWAPARAQQPRALAKMNTNCTGSTLPRRGGDRRQKCTSKGIWRQGIVLKHRNSLQKSICPVVICPYLCSSEGRDLHHGTHRVGGEPGMA